MDHGPGAGGSDVPVGGSGDGGSAKGNVLGRYHLGEPLGGGPTGEVFRSKVYGVAGYERQYAVKRFHTALANDPVSAERLASAARSYATITHPHIARLAEYGVTGDRSFVAVELVNGADLMRLISATAALGDPVPRGALLSMLVQVARAVAYAHGRGVVHGGLCPTNVVLSSDGDPKVTDFGLLRARLRGFPAQDPTLIVRLPYLAPEQLDGLDATPATDVFALATISTEVLTGERAFAGKLPQEIAAAVRAGPLEKPDIPPPVWEVLTQAFASTTGRFSNAGAFADALESAVKKLSLPGGRTDLAAAVKRVHARSADLAANASGAMSFPLPAPPVSTPGVALSSLFPDGVVPKTPIRQTLHAVVVPPVPKAGGSTPPPVPPASPREVVEVAPTLPAMPAQPRPPAPTAYLGPPRQRAAAIEVGAGVAERKRGGWPLVPMWGLAIAAASVVGWLAWDQLRRPQEEAGVVAKGRGKEQRATVVEPTTVPVASPIVQKPDAAATPAPAAAPVPVAAPDAAPAPAPAPVAAPPPDAAVVEIAPPVEPPTPPPTPPPPPPTPPPVTTSVVATPTEDGKLIIVSSPPGAVVYLDGAPKGKSPVELPASGDRHKLALLLEGYKLARIDISGKGKVEVPLEQAEKFKGPAGVKVRCKARNRYYIIVDGRHTGRVCPTERINVDLGDHVVEVYDALSDNSTAHQVPVRDTHFSVRISVDL